VKEVKLVKTGKQRAEDSELKRRFGEELEALKHVPFTLQTDAITAWSLMSQIQLALRHPKNIGPTADLARKTAQRIIDTLAPPGTALREVAEMGWDKTYDS